MLAKIFPNELNFLIISYKRTNWTQDPYSQMCYTYLTPRASPEDCSKIAESVDDKIYFAGEHTCFDFIGTVNGAYISGITASERIIGFYAQYFILYLLLLPILIAI